MEPLPFLNTPPHQGETWSLDDNYSAQVVLGMFSLRDIPQFLLWWNQLLFQRGADHKYFDTFVTTF